MEKEKQDTQSAGSPPAKKRKQALRSPVACTLCRKAKYKCVQQPSKWSCMRCDKLGLSCSLRELELSEDLVTMKPTQMGHLSKKIDDIHRGMGVLLSQSQQGLSPLAGFSGLTSLTANNAISSAPAIVPDKKPQAIDLDTTFFNTTPFRDVREVSSFYSIPFSKELVYDIKPDFERERLPFKYDVVEMQLVSIKLATELVTICRDMYGRLMSFPTDVKPKQLLQSIQKDSSLLLAVCCLIGLRHYKGTVKKAALDVQLLNVISQILSLSLMQLPQSKQFLQSMVLLSAYSLSLSKGSVYLDGWFLSGYALLHYITREMNLNFLSENFKSHPERMNHFRLWNHLALIHLSHCILSGRPCLIDGLRLDQCREILELALANNFDARIVAKLSILLTLYNCLQFHETLENSMGELESTWKDWAYLCEQQPYSQFIDLTYHFAKVMVLRREFMVQFAKGEDFMFQRPEAAESPLGLSASVFGNQPLGTLLKDILQECITVVDIAYRSNYEEFLKSSDVIKFMALHGALVLINTIRQGFDHNSWLSAESLVRAKNSLDQCTKLCENLERDFIVGNEFIRGYHLLIVKFGESIHEQEI